MQRIYVTIRPLNREDSVLYFPPEAFGPFRVLHQIGAGTLGPVFRAYEPAGQRRDRLVAVKVFRLDLTPEQSAALVGDLDALVGANINHPNIAAPIAAGLEHGAAYLAQEYAVGDSLDVVLRERGPMAMRDVVALVASLASAIDHAADRGVHHGLLHLRDIVLGADTVRLTGFGIAAALDKVGAQLPTRPTYALNAANASAGMPADVYSLMAMAFEAATGKRLSPDNLNELEAEYGADVRAAFEMQPQCAEDFAAALQGAIGAIGAIGAMGAKGATGAKPAPVAPVAPRAPDAPIAPIAPIALESDFDLRLDGAVDLMGDADDDPADRLVIEPTSLPPPPFPTPWSEQLPRVQHVSEPEPEQASRRWPIVVMFLVFAVLTALSVSFFLTPSPVADKDAAVDETSVDVTNPAPVAPVAPTPAPVAPTPAPVAPSPNPSRPASGAVRRTQTGSMLIRSTPADADVVVNGKPRGKTPLALRDLELGSYNIRVARDGYAADERTLQLTAQRPTTSTTITLRPTSAPGGATVGKPTRAVGDASATVGGLNVQSRPAGARVFVNDRLAGATPIAIPGLPAGDATVRIEKDGYQPWSTTVRIGAGEQMRVAASLERR